MYKDIFREEATGLENFCFKKFKGIWKDIDKSQDITTLTFESSSWLQQIAAKVCVGLQAILACDKEHSIP